MKKTITIAYAVLLMLLLPLAGFTQSQESETAWLTLAGEVTNIQENSFDLDYGNGTVIVDMEDWDSELSSMPIENGLDVIVSGEIDENFNNDVQMEAEGIYLKDDESFLISQSADRKARSDLRRYAALPEPLENGEFSIQGIVIDDHPNMREIVLAIGTGVVTVDLSELGRNVQDTQGDRHIEFGERVAVFGDFSLRFFEENTLLADRVIELEIF
ncbi:MAG: hypothetical protein ACLFR1_09870 [Spirochaetia bacterium]